MSATDRSAERWLVAHRLGVLDPVAIALSWIGNHALVWLVLAALLALGRRRPAILLATLAASLVSAGLVALIKDAVDRPRPPRTLRIHTLVPLPSDPSFPSGHASSSFACAVVLLWAVQRREARVGLLLLAAAIAASRAYVGVHYPFDVVGGALLGTAIGLVVLLGIRLEPRLRARFPGSPR